MTTMRVVLVDDEPLALRRLALALQDITGIELVGTARDGISAAEVIANTTPDLVILDIQMPGRSGLSLAAALPAEKRPEVVFVTAFEHYAPDAFEVEAADYLLKPVRPERLRQTVERVRRILALKRAHAKVAALDAGAGQDPASLDESSGEFINALWIPTKGGETRVGGQSIIWIEAAADYVILHTHLRSHMVRATISGLEKVFSPTLIRRVHRSSMVNLNTVEQVKRPGRGGLILVLTDGTEVIVGPNYAEAVSAALKLR